MNRALLVLTFILFTAFTSYVVYQEGLFGFLEVHRASMWGVQVILDLVIAIALFATWMVGDARRQGIPWPPYLLACLALGSIGALAYLLHRAFVTRATPPLHAGVARDGG